MTKIRITKRFTFEMAHALLAYDGLCKNIHGHSYVLWVTISGSPLNAEKNPKNGMLLDFTVLKTLINKHIIDVFDHALLLNNKLPENLIQILSENFEKVIPVNFQPTSENILVEFADIINEILPDNVKLFSLKLQETENSFTEWFAGDNN